MTKGFVHLGLFYNKVSLLFSFSRKPPQRYPLKWHKDSCLNFNNSWHSRGSHLLPGFISWCGLSDFIHRRFSRGSHLRPAAFPLPPNPPGPRGPRAAVSIRGAGDLHRDDLPVLQPREVQEGHEDGGRLKQHLAMKSAQTHGPTDPRRGVLWVLVACRSVFVGSSFCLLPSSLPSSLPACLPSFGERVAAAGSAEG